MSNYTSTTTDASDLHSNRQEPLALVEDRAADPTRDATAIAYDPVQGMFAVGFSSGHVSIHKHARSSRMHSVSASPITHLQFIPALATLAVVDDQGVLHVFDTYKMRDCIAYPVPSGPTSISFIPGTSWLLVGTSSGRVYFVDAVGGRKSDFSIGCRAKPASPVVAVEPHPVQTERIMIAYASGVCVVCDIGKAPSAKSERDIVLSTHTFEQHPQGLEQHPVLISATWSPDGSMVAATYNTGVLSIFNVDSRSRDSLIVARTIDYADTVSSDKGCQLMPEDLDLNTRCLRYVIWCTHAYSGKSLLLVSSGPSVIDQRFISIFGIVNDCAQKDPAVKSGNDLVTLERFSLDEPIMALCALPLASPWKNGREEVKGVAIVQGCPAVTRLLDILPSIQLQASLDSPGEFLWCQRPKAEVVYGTSDQPSFRIRHMLESSVPSVLQQSSDNPQLEPDATGVQLEKPIRSSDGEQIMTQVLCAADEQGLVSLWSIYGTTLERCNGVQLDVACVASMLGIKGRVVRIDMCAHSGLVLVAMDSGEAIFCVVTDDPGLSIAKRHVLCQDICKEAEPYYQNPLQTVDDSPYQKDSTGAIPGNERGENSLTEQAQSPVRHSSRVQSAHMDAMPVKRLSMHTRDRAASVHGGGFFRRNSKRLSQSINSAFRRASANDSHSQLSISDGPSKQCSRVLGRSADISKDVWMERLDKTNREMTPMVQGLRFSTDELQNIACSQQTSADVLAALGLTKIDSGTASPTKSKASDDVGLDTESQAGKSCVLLPFMFSRFYYRPLAQASVNEDGMAALVYEGGVVVVVDCVKQCVLLLDNINQAPDASHNSLDVFSGTHSAAASSTAADAKHIHQEITAVKFSTWKQCIHGQAAGTDVHEQTERSSNVDCLYIGTSLGQMIRYTLDTPTAPPEVVSELDFDSPIISISAVRDPNMTAQSHSLVIGSRSAVSLLSLADSMCTAKYDVCKTNSNASLVAVHTVWLESGRQVVAAIKNDAAAVILSLPGLDVIAETALPSARGLLKTAANVQINEYGNVTVLGCDGILLQARVVATDGGSAASVKGFGEKGVPVDSLYNTRLEPPPQPVRKGITSWLLGKSSNPAPDIDNFLGATFRDLLARGGVRPSGGRIAPPPPPSSSSNQHGTRQTRPQEQSMPGSSSRTANIPTTDLGEFSGMKSMAEMRGQRLEELEESIQRSNMRSKGFLDDIRAYNAKQEQKSKRLFGLF
ncbi:Syntaxin-binding protein 5 [Coemansia sp. Benny D115]|nr:Syntaxin-binding protein 5 [Coemansia sp. Benny D115]